MRHFRPRPIVGWWWNCEVKDEDEETAHDYNSCWCQTYLSEQWKLDCNCECHANQNSRGWWRRHG